MAQQREDTARSAWNEAGPFAVIKAADAGLAYRVDVLERCDRIEEPQLVDRLRQRQLDQDAGHVWIGIEPLDRREERFGGRRLLVEFDDFAPDADFRGHPALVVHVL